MKQILLVDDDFLSLNAFCSRYSICPLMLLNFVPVSAENERLVANFSLPSADIAAMSVDIPQYL